MAAMRCEAFFSGRVQGVGFRATAASLARRHGVTGWVRNEADGRVSLVVEADEGAIDAFLADLRHRLGEHITSEDVRRGGEERGYSGFEIR